MNYKNIIINKEKKIIISIEQIELNKTNNTSKINRKLYLDLNKNSINNRFNTRLDLQHGLCRC